MDFAWSKEQTAYRDKVIGFAQRELNHDVVSRDRESEFSQDAWKKCAEFGIQGLSVPARFNGKVDVDFLTAMLAMEGLGYGCRDNGIAFALNAQMWTVQLPILHFGNDEQKARYLPGMCQGELIGAHAISEPDSGSDVFSLTTRAERCADGFRLNGHKRFVSLGPIADVALTFASTDPTVGKWGISAFLVDTALPGVTVGSNVEKMGLRTVPFSDLNFNDCLVPKDALLGPEGGGVSLSTQFLEWERCCILASHLGAMQRQLEECINYASDRKQFGAAIGKNQSVANRIVEMKLRLETCRLLLYKVAWLKQNGEPAMLEAALLKLHLSEAFAASSLDAIRIHGGKGYVSENEIERDLRDAVGGTIYAGTSDIQRNIVARLLGL